MDIFTHRDHTCSDYLMTYMMISEVLTEFVDFSQSVMLIFLIYFLVDASRVEETANNKIIDNIRAEINLSTRSVMSNINKSSISSDSLIQYTRTQQNSTEKIDVRKLSFMSNSYVNSVVNWAWFYQIEEQSANMGQEYF